MLITREITSDTVFIRRFVNELPTNRTFRTINLFTSEIRRESAVTDKWIPKVNRSSVKLVTCQKRKNDNFMQLFHAIMKLICYRNMNSISESCFWKKIFQFILLIFLFLFLFFYYFFLLIYDRESIVFGSNFRNGDFD